MTYSEAVALRDALQGEGDALSAILQAFPRDGLLGMPEEHIRMSPEYRAAKAAYDAWFARLRAFNSWFVKTYAKEERARRRARARA